MGAARESRYERASIEEMNHNASCVPAFLIKNFGLFIRGTSDWRNRSRAFLVAILFE
jgi:hypothetical protein